MRARPVQTSRIAASSEGFARSDATAGTVHHATDARCAWGQSGIRREGTRV